MVIIFIVVASDGITDVGGSVTDDVDGVVVDKCHIVDNNNINNSDSTVFH